MHKEAKTRNCNLVVKPHPAEINPAESESIEAFVKKKLQASFLLMRTVFEIIEQSIGVVTINSTAGLEARIIGQPVQTLGASAWGHLDDDQLTRYIHTGLIDIDFFDKTQVIEISKAEQLVNRMNCDKSGLAS